MSGIVNYESGDNDVWEEDIFNDVRDTDYDAFVKLAQVFELNVFCPVHIEGENDWAAAYLMNDAVESFLIFEDSVMTGKYIDADVEQIPSVQMLEDGYMLIVNQGNKNTFTIKFRRLELRTHLFNYGSMGHFWIKGYEYLRQLEYQLADIRDKYRYLGEKVCNEKELLLMKLADFPPIKRFRSVPDQYYVPYPDCVYEEAVDYLVDIADSTGDSSIKRKLAAYKRKPSSLRGRQLAVMFGMRKHADFVDAIIAELREAASAYQQRSFSAEEQEKYNLIHSRAAESMNEYEKQGYKCMLYKEEPFMYSRDSITYKEHILVYINGIIRRKAKIVTFE